MKRLIVFSACLLLVGLPACGTKDALPPKPEFKASVQGVVTHKGKPVPYGAVVFYALGQNINRTTGAATPTGAAVLDADGKYKVPRAAIGAVVVCVVADPDFDLQTIKHPTAGRPHSGPTAPGRPGRPPSSGGMPPTVRVGPAKKEVKRPRPPGKPDPSKLTREQIAILKLVHQKYGSFEKSHLSYMLHEGDQTIDIKLD